MYIFSSCELDSQRLSVKVSGLPWCSNGWDSVLPIQEVWVRSLVRELRSLMLRGMAKKFKKQINEKFKVPKVFVVAFIFWGFFNWLIFDCIRSSLLRGVSDAEL